MPEKIVLSKDKVVLLGYDEGKVIETAVNTLTPFLGETVEIKDDFTLGDLLNLISKDCKFYEVVFSTQLGGSELQPFLDEAAQDSADDDDDGIEYLELYWGVDYDDDYDIEISPGFHGWGKYNDKMSKECGWDEGGFGIEFTPICNLKHYPLRLNKDFVVKRLTAEENETIVATTREYTLYDVIGGILFEISFCGLPKDRACKLAELDQLVAEVKDMRGMNDGGPELDGC